MTNMRLAYRVAEASALIGISEREGWRRVAAGDWQFVKCGRVTLIPAAALEEWLRRKSDEQLASRPELSPTVLRRHGDVRRSNA
jgi:excisionase family DNA binding protein